MQLDEHGMLIPVAEGIRHDSDGEPGCYVWALYRRSDVAEYLGCDVNVALKQARVQQRQWSEVASDLTAWSEYYSGPGRTFHHEPYLKVSRTRVLVKQYRGLDI